MNDSGPWQIGIEKRVTEVEQSVKRLDYEIFNGGQKGLSTRFDEMDRKVTTFIAIHNDREDQRDRNTRRNRWIIGTLIAVGTLLLGIHTWLTGLDKVQHNELKIPDIFHLQNTDPAYAEDRPEAQIPPLAR